jgi:hypothetical protein
MVKTLFFFFFFFFFFFRPHLSSSVCVGVERSVTKVKAWNVVHTGCQALVEPPVKRVDVRGQKITKLGLGNVARLLFFLLTNSLGTSAHLNAKQTPKESTQIFIIWMIISQL